MLVLSVEGEHPHADRAQIGRRRRAALHVCARTTLGGDAAREQQLVAVERHPLRQLGQLRVERKSFTGREHSLDVGLRGARAHDSRSRLAPQQQVEGVREHGLARARLPGDRVQARVERDLRALDQEQVLDTQLEEHTLRLPARADGAAPHPPVSSLSFSRKRP